MSRIWKFNLEIADEPTIDMPLGTHVLSVGEQNGGVFVWAHVPVPEAKTEKRHFFVIGTGNPIPWTLSDATFIGTVQANGFVWHVFDQRSSLDEGAV